ncbi:MAG: hypothetical protein MI975_00200 [Cytophagales bacterium]|nr:hypothetical protein [Cytophagales bacterium]
MKNKVLLSVTFLCTLQTGSLNPVIHPVLELKASDELTERLTSGYFPGLSSNGNVT